MKAKVLRTFRDKHTGEIYKVDKTLNLSRERFEEILTTGPLVEEVPIKKKAAEAETEE